MKNCLIIDDCPDATEMLGLYLMEEEIAVWNAESVEEAFSLLAEESFDLLFCDLHLPFTLGESMNEYLYSEEVGIRTIAELLWVYPSTPVIATSSAPQIDTLQLQSRLPGVPFFAKPFSRATLKNVLSLLPRTFVPESHLEALF